MYMILLNNTITADILGHSLVLLLLLGFSISLSFQVNKHVKMLQNCQTEKLMKIYTVHDSN